MVVYGSTSEKGCTFLSWPKLFNVETETRIPKCRFSIIEIPHAYKQVVLLSKPTLPKNCRIWVKIRVQPVLDVLI